MSFPKLSMRDVSKHPAVINDPLVLKEGTDIVLCSLVEPIGRQTRLAQAFMSLVPDVDSPIAGENPMRKKRIEGMKDGYRHTPTWGIIVAALATVEYVDFRDGEASVSAQVSRVANWASSNVHPGSDFAEMFTYRAETVDEVPLVAEQLPAVGYYDYQDVLMSSFRRTIGIGDFGRTKEQFEDNKFIVDLSKLR